MRACDDAASVLKDRQVQRPVRPRGQYGVRPERFSIMASNITLSAAVRQNLLSLQNTASLMSQTQNRLATGKKVNSALDNPGNFFTSSVAQQPRQRPQLAARLDRPGAEDARGRRPGPHLADQAGRVREVDRQAGPPGPAAGRCRLWRGHVSPATRPTKPGRFTGGTLASAVGCGRRQRRDASPSAAPPPTAPSTTSRSSAWTTPASRRDPVGDRRLGVGAGEISVTSGGAGNGALTLTAQDCRRRLQINADSTTADIADRRRLDQPA